MAKANAEATAERVDHLQGMILAGEPNTACLTYARQTWGVSRLQGYRLLKKAWQQIKNDIDESGIDRQELLSWSIQTLMAAGIVWGPGMVALRLQHNGIVPIPSDEALSVNQKSRDVTSH